MYWPENGWKRITLIVKERKLFPVINFFNKGKKLEDCWSYPNYDDNDDNKYGVEWRFIRYRNGTVFTDSALCLSNCALSTLFMN
jgi:hypothetical protein